MASLPDHLKPLPAGRRHLAREVREEHQRARILDAAIEVFAAKGYPAATVDDIVAGARIGVGSFYAHFSGKEGCLLEAYEKITAQAQGKVVEAAPAELVWEARVCRGLRALLECVAAEPVRANIAVVQIQTAGPPAHARYEETLESVATFVRLGREGLHRPPLPGSLEEGRVSGIAWLLHQKLLFGEADSVTDLFDDLAQMLLEPYLGAEGAKRAAAESSFAPAA